MIPENINIYLMKCLTKTKRCHRNSSIWVVFAKYLLNIMFCLPELMSIVSILTRHLSAFHLSWRKHRYAVYAWQLTSPLATGDWRGRMWSLKMNSIVKTKAFLSVHIYNALKQNYTTCTGWTKRYGRRWYFYLEKLRLQNIIKNMKETLLAGTITLLLVHFTAVKVPLVLFLK